MRLMLISNKYYYGRPEDGLSFERYNFSPVLAKMSEVTYFTTFDMDIEFKKLGDKMSKKLLDRIIDEKIDICFFVINHEEIDYKVLEKIKNNNRIKSIQWFCDDKWRFESHSKKIAPFFNWVISTDQEAINRYKNINYDNVIVSQWACNTRDYYRRKFVKEFDISFIGCKNPYRKWVVNNIKKNNLNIKTFGEGWKEGRVSSQEMVDIYNKSKIVLNLSNSTCWDIRFLFSNINNLRTLLGTKNIEDFKARFFEVTGCGSFLLTYYVDFLENYFNIGKEIAIYRDINNMIDKIKYYLKNNKEREDIAVKGYNKTIKNHNYEQRFRQIFKTINEK